MDILQWYLDMFEFKHVSLYKCFLDLLAGPGDEKFVVIICLLKEFEQNYKDNPSVFIKLN